jgi:hypothetical protein
MQRSINNDKIPTRKPKQTVAVGVRYTRRFKSKSTA